MAWNRRQFVKLASASAGSLLISTSGFARSFKANEKPNVVLIGVGGRGDWFVSRMPEQANVLGLCDVNDSKAAKGYKKLPDAKKYHDYRIMLQEMEKQYDGVMIAAPDHIHAPASSMAMKMGKHVYCEKPLTHNVYEARYLRELARKTKVATQMGNQGTATQAFRRANELIQAGVIGQVREAWAWNPGGGRGPQKIPTMPWDVPDYLNWDLWLGPAATRKYHPDWLRWRAWRDFGTSILGNWAVHTTNLAFKALRLDAMWYPKAEDGAYRLAARTFVIDPRVPDSPKTPDINFPRWEWIQYKFPARGKLPPVTLHWLNGTRVPGGFKPIADQLRARLSKEEFAKHENFEHAGLLIVGSEGMIKTNGHNARMQLLPEAKFKDAKLPDQAYTRSRGHEAEWFAACKGGPKAWSNFDYGGPLTELVLLGNVATFAGEPVEYDAIDAKVVNSAKGQSHLQREYRKGWAI